MKTIAPLLVLTAISGAALAADVGVSVTVNQPGLYGRIDIGNLPPPQLIYAEPRVIMPMPPNLAPPPPIYLHVPPGHEKHWRKHCAEYHACDRPVYFVHENWYRNVYEPRHRGGEHGDHGDRRRDDRHDQGRRDEGRGDEGDRGRGRGRGRGDN
jgi:hypothetical protein